MRTKQGPPGEGTPSTGLSQAPPSQIANSGSTGLINPAATVNDESSRDAEVTAREHMGSSSSLQAREEKQEPVVSRPPVTTSNTIPPAVVATVSATRAQSPVITTTAAHAADSALSRPTLSIQHPPSAAISIQRPAQSRDVTTRITLPSHPALGTPKQQLHTMAQKTIFSTGTPVAAATVAPILATNTIPSATTAGSVSHTQAPTSTIVTMTMPSHSSHATAVTTSNIPVAKVVPQQITHTSPRIQPDYPAERSSLIPISGHRASPNPVAMETRSDNRPSVPVQFQYFLPTYPPSAYPLAAHTYTPITSSVSTIRQYPAVVLADGATIVANPINSPFSAAPAATTVVQTHSQSASTSAPAQGSSPRPSILRKKPATDGLVQQSLATLRLWDVHFSLLADTALAVELN
ncbi:Histone deacetylase complex subunit SAP130 [Camelus dromedarius]|uniref:Histone deacetylase complex subunit SAP130 n=1 Tax=Camelus dromedarius TaxID=9838 RepID=A0A5N4E7J5_CAMDR|nr:Histone deacetylase complex subunit SAP130 [Camelus dromedarius]